MTDDPSETDINKCVYNFIFFIYIYKEEEGEEKLVMLIYEL